MALILSGTDGLSDVDGSAATPAIRGTDANTGIFFPAADTIAFSEGGTEAMRIDSSGNVGIGTNSPTEKVTSSNGFLSTGAVSSTARDGALVDYTASVSRFIAGRSGGNYGQWEAHVAGASGVTKRYQIDYNSTHYWYAADGTTESARIDSSGNLLVGTTSADPQTAGSGGKGIAIRGPIGFLAIARSGDSPIAVNRTTNTGDLIEFRYNGATAVGSISTNGTGTTYGTASDYRLKENIQPMTGALDKVALLKPVTYKWNSDGSSGEGFIAHELQAVVPDCVTGEKDGTRIEQYEVSPAVPATYDEDGNELTPAVEAVMGEREVPSYQGIDTSFLVATLTAALQELKALVDGQAVLIATQASTITALQADVEALKAPQGTP